VDIRWLGLTSSDIVGLPDSYLQPLSEKGKKEIQTLVSSPTTSPEHRAELLKMECKVELGSLNSLLLIAVDTLEDHHGFGYLAKFLLKKIAGRVWL
jgi:hypothetical protein